MPIVSAQDVCKSFGDRTVLAGVSVTIHSGDRVGLVGLNGSGKSTLARILAGIDAPDAGTVARRRGAEVSYLSQEPRFAPELTAREIVLAGLSAWAAAKDRHDAVTATLADRDGDFDHHVEEQAAAAAEVERLGGWERGHHAEAVLSHLGIMHPEATFGTLSGGERRRVALARILVAEPALAILDEPTNHLDVATIEWLERYLIEKYAGALLLITHDRYVLDRVVTRTLEIEAGHLYSYDGGFAAYLAAKADRIAHAERAEANRQNFLRRELEWLRRQPKARTGKQQARIQRIQAEAVKAPPKAQRSADLTMDASRTGKTILELLHLDLVVGGRTLVKDLELRLTAGERIGIVGPNGSGKTTLLRCILGEVAPAAGTVVVGQNTRLAYLDQLRGGLDDVGTVFENVAGSRGHVAVGDRLVEVRTYLERFLFSPSAQRQLVGGLSGGERARVALAKMLSDRANLLVLDEPTNDLDVDTLAALESMLLDCGGTALVVTHDRWFLDRVATSILAFEGDGRVVRCHGNYANYLASGPAITPEPAARPAPAPRAAATRRRLSSAERRELERLPEQIDAAERAVAALEARLADPQIYADGGGAQIPSLLREIEAAKATAARLFERWEQLESASGASG